MFRVYDMYYQCELSFNAALLLWPSNKKHKNLSLESVHVTNIDFLFIFFLILLFRRPKILFFFFSLSPKFSFFSRIIFYSFFLYHLNHFNICIHLYALLWKTTKKLWFLCCAAPLRKKGSDDNYLARYDKIIVTRSIFIFLRLSFLEHFTMSWLLSPPKGLWMMVQFFALSPFLLSQEVSIEKQFFTSSKYYELRSRWNAGGEWEALKLFKKSQTTLRGSKQSLSHILSLFIFCFLVQHNSRVFLFSLFSEREQN